MNAYKKGQSAFLRGVSFEANPYEPYTYEQTDWANGWMEEHDKSFVGDFTNSETGQKEAVFTNSCGLLVTR
jgi:ribosome modulation factor